MKKALSYFISALVFNTAIAGVLTILLPSISFWHEFIYSQCIGFSVLYINLLVVACVKSTVVRWAVFSVSLPLSVAVGLTLAFFITGVGSWNDPYVWRPVVIGLFFGFIGAIVTLLSERVGIEIKQRRLIQSESEKREIEAHLKLLQAQIEPHFLFNTLANVGSLIDTDPALAKKLLERLNDWLRVALARARSETATLGDELDMLENYLQILKVRFGDRLRWQIDVEDAVRQTPFPPMLLQPLVENAVRHGIEPKLGGGEILVRADVAQDRLRIDVSDSGAGLRSEPGTGTGLSNVRARLAALYGRDGRFSIEGNAGVGVTAVLEIPR